MPLHDATRLLLYCAVALPAACSSSEPERRLHDPGRLDRQQTEAMKAAEQAYRKKEGFEEKRDALAKDPVAAFWLTRMLVLEVVRARDPREISDRQRLVAAAGVRDAAENRAIQQIVAMGKAAAPCLVEDLLKHKAADRRDLGVELLGRIGEVAAPAVTPLLRDPDPRLRRTGMRAVAAMSSTEAVRELLVQGAGDIDFGVRGEALRGLVSGGPAEAVLLHKALVQDPDPFVRRMAAQALATYRDRETARLLIDYLERCEREDERLGMKAAQTSLQSLSGSRYELAAEAWRKWLAEWNPGQ